MPYQYHAAGKSPKDAKHFSYLQWTEHEGAFHLQPRVHWYDARARTALKEMATWLRYDEYDALVFLG